MSHSIFHYVGLIASILVLLVFLIRFFAPKGWWLRAGLGIFLGPSLQNAIQKFLEEVPNGVTKETSARVATHVIWRLTRIGILGLLITCIPIILLWQQNSLLNVQTEHMNTQNHLISIQNNLQIAESREQTLQGIYEKVNDSSFRDTISMGYILGKPLIGQIISVSRSLTPYRKPLGDTISQQLYSPERGQLLVFINSLELDSATMGAIVSQGDFTNSEVGYSDLSSGNFDYIMLTESNLRGTVASESSFRNAEFSSSNLSETYLGRSDFRYANLDQVNFQQANLSQVNFQYANLEGVNLTEANLQGADLTNAGGLATRQLSKAQTLFNTKGIPAEILEELKLKNPELFRAPN